MANKMQKYVANDQQNAEICRKWSKNAEICRKGPTKCRNK
jgi:hypothetical protein